MWVAASLPTAFATRFCAGRAASSGCQSRQLLLDPPQPGVGVVRQHAANGRRGQPRIVAPPVQTDLLRLVDGAYQQANLNGEQLDVRQVDLDVTGDDKPLVEHPVQNVDETVCPV